MATEWPSEILQAQGRSKKRYDKRHGLAWMYEKGDLVLVTRRISKKGKVRKFLPKFVGPFQVVRQVCENTYLVEDLPALR